jgi:aspartyl-tRNA(Asn)/glutamyl-tRNA(Gln) amidotransferase subunit A
MLADYKPPYSATVVRRLEAAGAVILGKTNLDEFGMGGSNENSAFGPVIHPTHSDRVAGGSSGGSAAAVAADLAWAALGSDTGGSVRQPAAFCGILGLKPTYGKISRSGLVAFASSLDTVGILARSPQDAELLLSVCSGGDELDATSLPEAPYAPDESGTPFEWSGLRLGVASDISESDLDPEVARAVRLFQERLCGLGASRVVLDFPHASQAVAVYYLIAMAEASSNLSRFDGVRFGSRAPEAESASDLKGFYQKVRSQFGSEVKRRILLGTFALSSGYRDAFFRRAAQVRRLIARDFDSAWSRADVLVLPVVPEPAFRLGERNSDPLKMYLADRFTECAFYKCDCAFPANPKFWGAR